MGNLDLVKKSLIIEISVDSWYISEIAGLTSAGLFQNGKPMP